MTVQRFNIPFIILCELSVAIIESCAYIFYKSLNIPRFYFLSATQWTSDMHDFLWFDYLLFINFYRVVKWNSCIRLKMSTWVGKWHLI